MTRNVQSLLDNAQTLSAAEKLELVQAVLDLLHEHYMEFSNPQVDTQRLPASIRRTNPVSDLNSLIADFWPDDENADEINLFITTQREHDRLSDL